jgi:acyl carrier protein
MQDQRVDTILDIIAESAKLDRSKLKLETPLDELNISSLTLIEAVFEIESRYDVEIPTEEFVKRPETTVGELIRGVLARIDVKSPVAAGQPAV